MHMSPDPTPHVYRKGRQRRDILHENIHLRFCIYVLSVCMHCSSHACVIILYSFSLNLQLPARTFFQRGGFLFATHLRLSKLDMGLDNVFITTQRLRHNVQTFNYTHSVDHYSWFFYNHACFTFNINSDLHSTTLLYLQQLYTHCKYASIVNSISDGVNLNIFTNDTPKIITFLKRAWKGILFSLQHNV